MAQEHSTGRMLMICRIAILACPLLVAMMISRTEGAGGMAEMKALTGDAPYLGPGNQEQAPEYFGEAAMRQYYQNPAYAYDGGVPYSRYSRNYYRSMPQYYRNYGGGYGGGGCPDSC